jgi:prepilin-type N-terminal cleavage/methylation domain-containing protein
MTAANPRPAPTRSTSGFTLAEVMVALAILGLAISTVAMVMRTAIRAWRVGHDMEEVTQTARLARDVINRDLNTLAYKTQSEYNRSFFGQLGQASGLYQKDYSARQGSLSLDDRFDFSGMTMPLDLSFRVKRDASAADGASPGLTGDNGPDAQGAGDGAADRLTFVCARTSQDSGDPASWNLRRVTYFVHARTLYRQEDDPYGFRPGQYDESFYNGTSAPIGSSASQREETSYSGASTMIALAQYFMKSGGDDYVKDDEGQDLATPSDQPLLPDPFENAEPLCDGVESFRVSCGYFKDGKWNETPNWDSSARQFRVPPTFKKIDDKSVDMARTTQRQNYVVVDGVPSLIVDRGRSDDLPAYVVLALSMRGPTGVGRPSRHAFFFSLSMAEEMDVYRAQGESGDDGGDSSSSSDAVPDVNLKVPTGGSEPEQ